MSADQFATLTTAAARKAAAALNTADLVAIDIEFARRATVMGRTGFVSKAHAAVRNALIGR